MNDSLEHVLHRYFDDVARLDHLGDTPVGVVMRRGRRRRVRRRTGAMAGTLMVGALGSLVAVRTVSGGDGSRQVQVGNPDANGGGLHEAPSPVPTDGDAGARLAPSPLVWNEVTVGSAEALVQTWLSQSTDVSSSTYYALSTEPGRHEQHRPAIYRSADGLHWERSGAPPEQFMGRPSLAVGSDRLYVVGTMAATAPVSATFDPGVAVIRSSADGGGSWEDSGLPIDLAAIRALPGVRAVTLSPTVVGTADRVLVAAVSRAELDLASFAPHGVDGGALQLQPGYGAVEYQVEPCDGAMASTTPPPLAEGQPRTALGETGCMNVTDPVRTHSWAELGVPEAAAAAHLGQLHLAVSTDGSTFEALTPPALPDGWLLQHAHVATDGDGFVLVVGMNRVLEPASTTSDGHHEQRSLAFGSADGTVWTPIEMPLPWVETVGTIGDGSLTIVGSDGHGAAVAVRRADGWHTTRLNDLASPGGVEPEHLTSFGTTLGSAGIAALVRVAEPPLTGSEAVDAAASDTATATTVSAGLLPGRTVLLFSRDGVTWSAEELDGSIGPDRYVNGLRQAGGQVIIDVGDSRSAFGPDEPLPDRAALVGTPA